MKIIFILIVLFLFLSGAPTNTPPLSSIAAKSDTMRLNQKLKLLEIELIEREKIKKVKLPSKRKQIKETQPKKEKPQT